MTLKFVSTSPNVKITEARANLFLHLQHTCLVTSLLASYMHYERVVHATYATSSANANRAYVA